MAYFSIDPNPGFYYPSYICRNKQEVFDVLKNKYDQKRFDDDLNERHDKVKLFNKKIEYRDAMFLLAPEQYYYMFGQAQKTKIAQLQSCLLFLDENETTTWDNYTIKWVGDRYYG